MLPAKLFGVATALFVLASVIPITSNTTVDVFLHHRFLVLSSRDVYLVGALLYGVIAALYYLLVRRLALQVNGSLVWVHFVFAVASLLQLVLRFQLSARAVQELQAVSWRLWLGMTTAMLSFFLGSFLFAANICWALARAVFAKKHSN